MKGYKFPKTALLVACLTAFLFATDTLAQNAIKVLVVPVVSAPVVEELASAGTVLSPQYSGLSPRIDGLVQSLYVDVGDQVNTGDPLLSLDDKIARLEKARLSAALEEADHEFQDADRLATEAQELVKNRHISQTEYESRIARASAAEASVAQLKAQLAIQTERIARHTLKAPFAGVIAEKMTEAGQWVNDNNAVLRLAQMDPLFIELKIAERYFGKVLPGAEIQIQSNHEQGNTINARIERVVPVSDINSRTFVARVVIPNPQRTLIPGMSVRAVIQLQDPENQNSLQVPSDAVVRQANGNTLVWVARESSEGTIAQPIPVSVGRSTGKKIEIFTGDIQAGDFVVTLGNESLVPGQAISIDRPS